MKPVPCQVRFHCWPAVSLLKYVLQSFFRLQEGQFSVGATPLLISLTKQRHTSLIIIHRRGSTSQSAIVGECACAATMPTRVEPIIVCATVSPEGGPLSAVLVDDYVGGCPRTTPPSRGRVPSFTSTHDPLVNSVLWSSLVIELYCVTHSTNYRLRRRLTLLLFVFHLFTMFLLKASSVLKSVFCTKNHIPKPLYQIK